MQDVNSMNVVLVILDSLRKDHVGVYGGAAKTPNLDALSGESLRFTRAYPESMPTIPARRALHTGLRTFPFRNWEPMEGEPFMPAGWAPIPEDQTTLSETLLTYGYSTVLFSDTQHLFKPSMNFQRGFKVYDWVRGQERDRYRPTAKVSQKEVDRYVLPGNDESMEDKVRQYLANTQGRNGEEDYFAPRLFSLAGDFIERSEEGQPFFLVVDSFDPHEPWDPPQEYVGTYADGGYEGPEPIVPNYGDAGWISDEELDRMRALYAAEVTMVDKHLGTFLDRMESAGRMDDTLLVVLSDHGVALGEHDATGKPSWALYPETTDIPFMIRHPEGKAAGRTSDFFASTHDVAPTILGTLGVRPSGPLEGTYLSQLDGGEPNPRDHFTLGYDDYVWARDDRYAMTSRNDRSDAKLYDLRNDPQMNTDIAGDNPDVVERMFDDYVLKDARGDLPRY